MELTQKAWTRLTLALDIVGRLDNGPYAGYHELAAVKHQVDLADDVCVEEATERHIDCDDSRVPVDERNICWRAVDCVKKRFGVKTDVRIKLRKHIPVMGGLAGGSADAAAVIMLLNRLWKLNLDRREMGDIGRNLGMDVPFYFTGGTALDSESTGLFRTIPTDLKMIFVLAVPVFGVSTAQAYASLDYGRIGRQRASTESLIHALETGDCRGVAAGIHNDFENTVMAAYPALGTIKQTLEKAEADAVFMTGSGSTVAGLARNRSHALEMAETLRRCTDVQETIVCRSLNTEPAT